jgi:hypothetical protein
MAESTVIRTKRDGIITITDSGGAHSYVVAYEPGDFEYSVPDAATLLMLDRGVIGATPSLRLGDEEPMTFSFSAHFRDAGSTTYATLLDILHRYAGNYVVTSWVSTLGTSSDVPLTLTVALTIDGTAFGEADRTLTFPYSVLKGDVAEGDPNKVSVKGTSYRIRPTLS